MDATKTCPFCAEVIPDEAVKCPFCRSDLPPLRPDDLSASPAHVPKAAASPDVLDTQTSISAAPVRNPPPRGSIPGATRRPRSNPSWLWIVLGATLAVIASVVAFQTHRRNPISRDVGGAPSTTIAVDAVAVGAEAERPMPSVSLEGTWHCQLDDYPPMRCEVTRTGERLWLEKTQGSQRIKGFLTLDKDQLRFEGTFFCPLGDCTGKVHGYLQSTSSSRDSWSGILHSTQIGETKIRLTR